MKKAAFAGLIVIGAIGGAYTVMALPEGFIDPSGNATIKAGRLRIDGRDMATVSYSLTNVSKINFEIAAVACTALIGEEPVETNHSLQNSVAPGQTAYGDVHFFKLRGRTDAMASCRVEYIKIDS